MQKYVTKKNLTTELCWHEADNIPFLHPQSKITRCGDTAERWDKLLKNAIKYLIDVMLPPFHLLFLLMQT